MWSWHGWSTVGAVRGGEKGCPHATCPRDTRKSQPCSPSPAGCSLSTQMERKTAFGPGEGVSKQTQRKHTATFQPLSRNWWILDHTHCIFLALLSSSAEKSFLWFCYDSVCAKCFPVWILPQEFYFCALLGCTDPTHNITDKELLQGRIFLNAEQTAGAVRCSNLSCVHSEQLIM